MDVHIAPRELKSFSPPYKFLFLECHARPKYAAVIQVHPKPELLLWQGHALDFLEVLVFHPSCPLYHEP